MNFRNRTVTWWGHVTVLFRSSLRCRENFSIQQCIVCFVLTCRATKESIIIRQHVANEQYNSITIKTIICEDKCLSTSVAPQWRVHGVTLQSRRSSTIIQTSSQNVAAIYSNQYRFVALKSLDSMAAQKINEAHEHIAKAEKWWVVT